MCVWRPHIPGYVWWKSTHGYKYMLQGHWLHDWFPYWFLCVCNVCVLYLIWNALILLNRQWWYCQMAIHMVVQLIRHDHPLPASGIKLLANSLVHDALSVRKVLCMYVRSPHTCGYVTVYINLHSQVIHTTYFLFPISCINIPASSYRNDISTTTTEKKVFQSACWCWKARLVMVNLMPGVCHAVFWRLWLCGTSLQQWCIYFQV